MLDTPEIIDHQSRPTAVIHLAVPRAGIGEAMDGAIRELLEALKAEGLSPAGPCFSYHPKRPTDMFDFEVGFPVAGPVTPAGRVRPGSLPAGRVARTTYRGGYDGLGAAWGEFCTWIEAQGLSPREDLWECYLSGPESSPDPGTWRTELNRPLEP
jgi:effector-binding domain-containing protein